MGLFGFGKKKYDKNVSRDNEFLKDYATKCNGLSFYLDGKDNVQKELTMLKDDFQYTVASIKPEAKKIEKSIKADFEALTALLQQSEWEETQALMLIRNLRRYVNEIGSLR